MLKFVEVRNIRSCKVTPCWINGLLSDEGHKVKLGIKLVCFCARVGDESLLIELLCNLPKAVCQHRPQVDESEERTSKTFFGASLSSRDPAF